MTKAALENISGILITAGLRSEFRTDVLKRNLITIMEIRDEAMKCEELILEKAVKTNGKNNGKPISEVTEEDVNAVGYNNNNRGRFHGNNSNNRDIVVTTTGATQEVAKTTKCQIKTIKPISLPTKETTLKEEEDKTEEVE